MPQKRLERLLDKINNTNIFRHYRYNIPSIQNRQNIVKFINNLVLLIIILIIISII